MTVLSVDTGKVCSTWNALLLLSGRCHCKGRAGSQGENPWSPPSGQLGSVKGNSSSAQILCGERRVISNRLWTNIFVKYNKKLLEKLYKDTHKVQVAIFY